MVGEPLKHHYIPQFYSKWWTGDDGRLVRYDQPHPGEIVERRKFPKAVGWAPMLYAIPGVEGPEAQMLETGFFRNVDTHASVVLRKMNEPKPKNLTDEERSIWTIFVRSLLHRTPHNLAATKAAGIRAHREAVVKLREKYSQLQKPGDPGTYEDYIKTQGDIRMEQGVLRNLDSILLNGNIGRFFVSMFWRYIDIPKGGRTFLFSDDPIVRTNGLKTDIGHLAIPLSPTRLFVATYRKETMEMITRSTPRVLTSTINTQVVQGARYFVGATDLLQDAFIRKHFGKSPRDAIMQPFASGDISRG